MLGAYGRRSPRAVLLPVAGRILLHDARRAGPLDDSVDKERVLDYVFDHQRITKVNDAMLAQYGATRENFLGLTPSYLYRHDLVQGRVVWREFFDRGRLHIETDERRLDGTPMVIEGDY